MYIHLLNFICREKTDLKFSEQDMQPCLDKKCHAFEEPTEISHRVLLSLLKMQQIDVEFRDTTLTVPARTSGNSEYPLHFINNTAFSSALNLFVSYILTYFCTLLNRNECGHRTAPYPIGTEMYKYFCVV